MTTTTIETLDHDQAELAHKLLDGAQKRSGLTKPELRAVLQSGYAKAYSYGHPSTWEAETPHDRAVIAAGRLVLRLRDELFLPMESMTGPSAISIAEELLK